MINPLEIDTGAQKICTILQTTGFQAYIVGGCVRDLLLGETPKDWDICTDASPEDIIRIFPKTYPTGLQHGTITVAIANDHPLIKEKHYEVTTFRTEGKYTDGRRPDTVSFVKNVKEDLMRRDFTINAMAYDPINHVLIDPFNGQKDLKNKILRAVGHAVERFNEDSLRIMRAARFATRFGYKIEHTTLTGMAVCSSLLNNISKERIKDELFKILSYSRPSIGLNLLHDIESLEFILPDILTVKNSNDIKNDFVSIDNCNGMVETRLAILFWDCLDCVEPLKQLTCSNDEIKNVSFILNTFKKFFDLYSKWYNDTIPSQMFREGLAYIKNNSPYGYSGGLNEFIKFANSLRLYGLERDLESYRHETVWGRNELQISGKDLITMGMTPSPKFKEILDSAYEEVIKCPSNNNREYLIKFISSTFSSS